MCLPVTPVAPITIADFMRSVFQEFEGMQYTVFGIRVPLPQSL